MEVEKRNRSKSIQHGNPKTEESKVAAAELQILFFLEIVIIFFKKLPTESFAKRNALTNCVHSINSL